MFHCVIKAWWVHNHQPVIGGGGTTFFLFVVKVYKTSYNKCCSFTTHNHTNLVSRGQTIWWHQVTFCLGCVSTIFSLQHIMLQRFADPCILPQIIFFVWFRFCSMFNILKSSHFPQHMFVSIHFHICRICIYHIFGSGWPPGFLGHGGGREVVGGLWHWCERTTGA